MYATPPIEKPLDATQLVGPHLFSNASVWSADVWCAWKTMRDQKVNNCQLLSLHSSVQNVVVQRTAMLNRKDKAIHVACATPVHIKATRQLEVLTRCTLVTGTPNSIKEVDPEDI
jgi:hypothetical protein